MNKHIQIEVLTKLAAAQAKVAGAILLVPTSDIRNDLTDINIALIAAIDKIQDEKGNK